MEFIDAPQTGVVQISNVGPGGRYIRWPYGDTDAALITATNRARMTSQCTCGELQRLNPHVDSAKINAPLTGGAFVLFPIRKLLLEDLFLPVAIVLIFRAVSLSALPLHRED